MLQWVSLIFTNNMVMMIICPKVLKRAEEYKAALAIAVSRLPDQDPVIQELMSSWAIKSIQDGNLTLAAKCWTSAGYPEKAADALAKLGTRDGLQVSFAVGVDRISDQLDMRGRISGGLKIYHKK